MFLIIVASQKKNETLNGCWLHVGPPSLMLAQNKTNNWSTSRRPTCSQQIEQVVVTDLYGLTFVYKRIKRMNCTNSCAIGPEKSLPKVSSSEGRHPYVSPMMAQLSYCMG